ncbi:MAG: hypothetical protein EBY30_06410 [Rhodospirillales bacterium]|nr:hypothetical protein [Rhodospirillales bacterium]
MPQPKPRSWSWRDIPGLWQRLWQRRGLSQAINRACVQHRVALVSGAAIGFDAQLSVYDSAAGGPCYACLFPPEAAPEEVRCATMGVFAPLVGIVGSMQAAEALKLLIGTGSSLAGRLLMLDGRSMQWNEIALRRDAHCKVCASPWSGGPNAVK